ncbi:hypothetical protein V8C86DRAFT_2841189 [Haematococcus lacustris]
MPKHQQACMHSNRLAAFTLSMLLRHKVCGTSTLVIMKCAPCGLWAQLLSAVGWALLVPMLKPDKIKGSWVTCKHKHAMPCSQPCSQPCRKTCTLATHYDHGIASLPDQCCSVCH